MLLPNAHINAWKQQLQPTDSLSFFFFLDFLLATAPESLTGSSVLSLSTLFFTVFSTPTSSAPVSRVLDFLERLFTSFFDLVSVPSVPDSFFCDFLLDSEHSTSRLIAQAPPPGLSSPDFSFFLFFFFLDISVSSQLLPCMPSLSAASLHLSRLSSLSWSAISSLFRFLLFFFFDLAPSSSPAPEWMHEAASSCVAPSCGSEAATASGLERVWLDGAELALLYFSSNSLSCSSTRTSLPFSFSPCLAPLWTQWNTALGDLRQQTHRLTQRHKIQTSTHRHTGKHSITRPQPVNTGRHSVMRPRPADADTLANTVRPEPTNIVTLANTML